MEDSIVIFVGLKEMIGMQNGIRVGDAARVSAATVSARYITDRFLPDKAIDLVDEAASRLRMQVDSKPEELDELDRKIIQLKIEREALRKEEDSASMDRLAKLEQELVRLEEESAILTQRWQAEKDKLSDATKLKEQLDEARVALDQAQRQGDLAKAGELAYGQIPLLESQITNVEELQSQSGQSGQAPSMVERAVTPGPGAQEREGGGQGKRG